MLLKISKGMENQTQPELGSHIRDNGNLTTETWDLQSSVPADGTTAAVLPCGLSASKQTNVTQMEINQRKITKQIDELVGNYSCYTNLTTIALGTNLNATQQVHLTQKAKKKPNQIFDANSIYLKTPVNRETLKTDKCDPFAIANTVKSAKPMDISSSEWKLQLPCGKMNVKTKARDDTLRSSSPTPKRLSPKLLPQINTTKSNTSSTKTMAVAIFTSELSTMSALAITPEISDNITLQSKSQALVDEYNRDSYSSPASENRRQQISSVTAEKKRRSIDSTASLISLPVIKRTQRLDASGGPGTCVQLINVVANGTIPKSPGKPLLAALNKKLNKPTRSRKHKARVAMYESEISANKIGIRLCIKKSDTTSNTSVSSPSAETAVSELAVPGPFATKIPSSLGFIMSTTTKPARKRQRKSKTRVRIDSDDSEYETKRSKKDRGAQSNAERTKKVSFNEATKVSTETVILEPVEQTQWGAQIPENVLYQVFQIIIEREGCLPSLLRLGRVCTLWRRVALAPVLWRNLDLSTWIREKYRNELLLKWFVDNRCSACVDLNVASFKVAGINCFLSKLAVGCPNLTGITLSGWKGFTSEHLAFLVDNMKKLERLDLSSVNVEMNASKSAVGVQSLCSALQTMNKRLTHLYLAHNRLAGIPQIVSILSAHCPNVMLMDLSNVTTQATSHGILHIEKLQHGCRQLKVLRVTNSHVTLSSATMQEMMESPGFPDLEELSVAVLTDESRVISDDHLQRILKTSSKLKLLDVRGCTRLTHESLIRLPAWDIKHLFLSGCSVTRDVGSGLELIASKWAHSLIELDLAWANVQQPLDNALHALAEKANDSPLAHLNLCGSSVSEAAVKDILTNCVHMSSINLASCRGLPRGVKRLMQGPQELQELRDVLKVQMRVHLQDQENQEHFTNDTAIEIPCETN